MSMRLSTRYTVVPLEAASLSMGVSECTKCDTSAMSGSVGKAASKKVNHGTYEHQPRCSHSGVVEHVERRQYPGSLKIIR